MHDGHVDAHAVAGRGLGDVLEDAELGLGRPRLARAARGSSRAQPGIPRPGRAPCVPRPRRRRRAARRPRRLPRSVPARPRRRRARQAPEGPRGPSGGLDAWGYASEGMRENLEGTLAGLPRKPGVYVFRDEQGEPLYVGQGEVAAPSRAQLLPAQRRPRGDRTARGPHRRRRGHRHAQRGRGAASRAEPRQALPAAVQYPAAGRQVVPVHRGHPGGRVPAGHVHAGTAPARHRVLRAVRECEEGTRDAGRPEPRLQVPSLRRAAARPPLRDSLPRLPHRPLLRAVREGDLRRGLRRDHRGSDRVPLRRHDADPARARGHACRRRRETSASRRRRGTETGSSRSGISPSGRRRTSAPWEPST